jgi:hypothetical protein
VRFELVPVDFSRINFLKAFDTCLFLSSFLFVADVSGRASASGPRAWRSILDCYLKADATRRATLVLGSDPACSTLSSSFYSALQKSFVSDADPPVVQLGRWYAEQDTQLRVHPTYSPATSAQPLVIVIDAADECSASVLQVSERTWRPRLS